MTSRDEVLRPAHVRNVAGIYVPQMCSIQLFAFVMTIQRAGICVGVAVKCLSQTLIGVHTGACALCTIRGLVYIFTCVYVYVLPKPCTYINTLSQ